MDTNRPEYDYNGYNALSGSSSSNYIPNAQTNPKPVIEPKLILTIITIVGIPSYIGAMMLNLGNWKGNVLFCLAAAFGLFKFGRLVWRTIMEAKERNIELKAKKRRWEKDVWD